MAVFEKNYRIYSFQGDFLARAGVIPVCHWLQEAAIEHADSVGFGTKDLHKLGLFWAINRWAIAIDRYPRSEEDITVQTWVSSQKGPFTEREYHMLSAAGAESLVRASSLWFAVDLGTRKPVPITRITDKLPLVDGKKSYPGMPQKVQPQEELKEVGQIPVRFVDLDYNHHVNNVTYLDWVLSTVDNDRYKEHEIDRLSINFIGEALLEHERVAVLRKDLSDSSNYFEVATPQKEVLLRLELHWRKSHDP